MRGNLQRVRAANIVVAFAGAAALLLASRTTYAQPQPVIQAPKLQSMPELTIPAEVALPENGRVEATITVAADGSATVDTCDADEPICERVGSVMAGARFEPARRDGSPTAARIRIALRVSPPPTGDQGVGERLASPATGTVPSAAATTPAGGPPASTTAAAAPSTAATPAADDSPRLAYGARARTHQVQPGARRLELAEMRDLPGAFGDPFRAVDALPGVVPVLSGLPYFFIRGSPPAGTLYLYDDIPVPTLFHLAVGPAVIHPLMVGPITLYSGVPPARYGRITGGVIVGEGPAPGDGQTHVETELRLLDVSGYVQTSLLGGTVTGAVRYGYPALLLSIFSPEVSLAYWDYQFRYSVELSPTNRFELVSLGSYDSFGVKDEPADALAITFHRLEPRFIHHVGRDEFGAAVLLGWERSELGSAFQLQDARIGPRLWYEHRFAERNRLRLSADMQGISGNFTSIPGPGRLNRNTSSIGLVGNVRTRSLWGAQGELTLRPWSALELQLGVRADAWLQSGGAQAVVDPRLRAIVHVSDTLDFHVAAGIVHQPAVFYLPLPGISDLANDAGLQTALQSEAGLGWDTPWKLRAELQLFLHRYENLVFTDTLLLRDALDNVCSDNNPIQIDCSNLTLPKRLNGYSYGMEVFLRRPITERLSGFLSYTLAFSAVDDVAGQKYTPTWDVRHVANLVLQWQIGAGFSAGLRWFIRSGKMHGEFLPDPTGLGIARSESRLPGFMRLDLEAAYAWPTHWGRLRVALEWFNTTMSREPADATCSGAPLQCQTTYLPAIFFPNLSIRGEH